jgi:hypothetical protein
MADSAHDAGMTELSLGRGWRALGMAQVFPIVTTGFGADAVDRVTDTELYATQPAVMFNIESPGSRFVLRTTLNFEGVTQPDGELTFGGWGEGFIDRRHPHTLLHEAMLSVNFDDVGGGALSVSAGKGFAPYGTDDPMSRPVVKYPTNHHLSQVLERYLVSVAWLRSGLSVEAGIFDGTEPTGAYDFDNFRHFPNSWSARLTGRFGGVQAPWELSVSYAHVVEVHHDERSPDAPGERVRAARCGVRFRAAVRAGGGLAERPRRGRRLLRDRGRDAADARPAPAVRAGRAGNASRVRA